MDWTIQFADTVEGLENAEKIKVENVEIKFEDFKWDYEKVFYDVLLPTWEIIRKCWANAWFLQRIDWIDWSWWEWECKFKRSEDQMM